VGFADRETVQRFIEEQYGAEPEYLWAKYPEYAVFRRQDNRKWFAVLMNVPKKKLGLEGEEVVEILDLKCDPKLIGALRKNQGFLPAYHMSKENWITVLLDGSVSMEELEPLLDMSYGLAKGGKSKGGQTNRHVKEKVSAKTGGENDV